MNMNKSITPDYFSLNYLGKMWDLLPEYAGKTLAVWAPHLQPEVKLNYHQLAEKIKQFAAALQSLGVAAGEKVALIADNSPRWLIADQGIIVNGSVDAVRSSQAEREELLYIIEHSDSVALVVEDEATLNKLRPEIEKYPLKFVVTLFGEKPEYEAQPVYSFEEFLQMGGSHQFNPPDVSKDSLATLIYTSGTTGKPKGVMLSHRNLLHQVCYLDHIIKPNVGDRVLTLLPSWHSYERAAEYFLFSRGCTLIYTSIRHFKQDLKQYKPHHMVGVPRLWESIYDGIQKQFKEKSPLQQKIINFFLGVSEKYHQGKRLAKGLDLQNLQPTPLERLKGNLQALLYYPLHKLGDRLVYSKIREGVGGCVKTWVSGGGSLAVHIDNFFQLVGIPLIVGYGLTETSPVTNARRLQRNIVGSAGQPLPETEIKIVHPETHQPLPPGEKGLIWIRGTQVMQGYYKNPTATAKAINEEGWFDSGDLGWITPMNDLVITGRAKDTIVLSNGENIEPQPLEDACMRSPYIHQIMVVGQDQKYLGALIVPDLEAIKQWAKSQNLSLNLPSPNATREEVLNSDLYSTPVLNLFKQELNREIKNRPGYRPDDRIAVFEFIVEPFSVANGMMTQTLKIKRAVITSHYQDIIDSMFNR